MKRDLELIRQILINIRDTGTVGNIKGYSEQAIAYHHELLLDAELIKFAWEGFDSPRQLTWNGHEILDGLGTEDEWKCLKLAANKAGISINDLGGWEAVSLIITEGRIVNND